MTDAPKVYSTETGRVCPSCGRPKAACACRKGKTKPGTTGPADGILRIRREVKGRGGKTVTTVTGFHDADQAALQNIARTLKNQCGAGGSVKEGVLVIQGDHREAVKAALEKQGFRVKLAGG